MADFFALRVRAGEVEELWFQRAKVAEMLRERETRQAVRLQSVYRGLTVRRRISHWNATALCVQRCTRGHLGRQRARRQRIERDTRRQRAIFDTLAITVQKRFRAYYTRKYRHNFYARKAYVASVLRKGDLVRDDLKARMESQVREQLESQEVQARERVHELSKRLHHLRSTTTCAGIYNSAYHVGHHPTAFGVPVEQHLRTAIRPVIKQELAARARTLKPIASLPPINPHKTEMSYDYVQQQARQEKWINKTKRIAGPEFNPTGGVSQAPFPGSVHIGTKYNSPLTLERTVEKDKWVTQEPFYNAVPSDRIVSSRGAAREHL